MGYLPSLSSKAAHFVSDLTTVILSPVSERETSHLPEVDEVLENLDDDKDSEHNSDSLDGPDTSSFRAFLISFLSSSSSNNDSMEIIPEQNGDMGYPTLTPMGKGSKGRTGLLSRGKHSIGKIINKAARISGFKQTTAEPKIDREAVTHTEPDAPVLEHQEPKEVASFALSDIISKKGVMDCLLLLFHSSSSDAMLQVVGDKKGTVFGGLVEAPLQPSSSKKYQGTNNSFVFTNLHNRPVIYRPTGANNYFTMCSTDYLALGGGGHFALYLDADLLIGSSSNSETFNNGCLSHSSDFSVKDVELWGFVYPSKYEEMLTLCRTEKPGICRW
ncbi:TLD-domain containing nucleolar protein [Zea mays]|uniref:Oxidation resistance protein 1 n=1 Tax=Zea mays TaxID=4577 RepID=A0A1D6QEC9_MAIZE|nr:TLD-domain containing nucleolar protein [Zea mays]